MQSSISLFHSLYSCFAFVSLCMCNYVLVCMCVDAHMWMAILAQCVPVYGGPSWLPVSSLMAHLFIHASRSPNWTRSSPTATARLASLLFGPVLTFLATEIHVNFHTHLEFVWALRTWTMVFTQLAIDP